MAGVDFKITGDDRELIDALNKSEKKMDEFLSRVERAGRGAEDAWSGVGGAIGGATAETQKELDATVEKSIALGKELERVGEELEKLTQKSYGGQSLLKEGVSHKEVDVLIAEQRALKQELNEVEQSIESKRLSLIELQQQEEKNTQSTRSLGSQRSQLREQMAQLIMEGKKETDQYRELEVELRKIESAYQGTNKEREVATVTLRTQLIQIREQMSALRLEGRQNTEEYRKLEAELQRLGTAYRQTQEQQKALVRGGGQIAGVVSGLQGAMGLFAVSQGTMSLFVEDNEKLLKIQTRLQALMSIMIGLQQTSNTLHKTSAFRINTVNKVTTLWAAAQNRVTAALGGSAVAANVLMGALTLGLSVAIGALVGALSRWSTKQKELREEQKAAAEETKQQTEAIASSASKVLLEYKKLQAAWRATNGKAKEQTKFLKENKEAFDKLGISVNDVRSAENLFVNNESQFVKSVLLRAKVAAAMEIAAEKYKEGLQKMIELDKLESNRVQSPEYVGDSYMDSSGKQEQISDYIGEFTAAKFNKEAKEAMSEGDKILEKALSDTELTGEILKELGIDLTKGVVDVKDSLGKAILKAELELQRSQIELMTEGREREQAELELNHQQRLQRIEQERQELIAEYKKAGKEMSEGALDSFDQRKTNEITLFTTQSQQIDREYEVELEGQYRRLADVFLSEEERKQAGIKQTYDEHRKWAKEWHKAGNFGSGEEGETAYKTFVVEIDKAETKEMFADSLKRFKSYQTEVEETIKEYDIEIERLRKAGYEKEAREAEKQKKEALSSLQRRKLEESGLWRDLFQDLARVSTSALKEIYERAEEELRNAKELSAADMKALREQLDSAHSEIVRRNPFDALRKAYEKYLVARKRGDKTDLTAEWADVRKASAESRQMMTDLGGSFAELSSLFSDKVGDSIQSTISLINDGIAAFESFGGSGEKSAGDIVSGMKSLIGIITTIAGTVVNAFDDSAEIAAKNAELARQQHGYWESINYQVERYIKLLKEASGEDYLATVAKSLRALEDGLQRAKEAATEFRSGEVSRFEMGLFSYYNIGKWTQMSSLGLSEQMKSDIEQVVAALKSMDEEQLRALKENAAIWSQIPSWMQEAIEQVIDYGEQIKELKEELSKELLQTTSSEMEDSILEWLKSGKRGIDDMGDYFNKVMRDALLQSFVIEQLRPKIQEFYNKYKAYADSDGDGVLDLTSGEIDELQEEWTDILEWAQTEADALTSILGDISDANREASSKGIQVATQDSVDETNGRLTVMQQHTYDISQNTGAIAHSTHTLVSQGEEIVRQFRLRQEYYPQVLLHLSQIESHTSHIPQMADDMGSVRSELSDISSRGVRVRK